MPPASALIPATAPSAPSAASSAYSIRSWPSVSLMNRSTKFFMSSPHYIRQIDDHLAPSPWLKGAGWGGTNISKRRACRKTVRYGFMRKLVLGYERVIEQSEYL